MFRCQLENDTCFLFYHSGQFNDFVESSQSRCARAYESTERDFNAFTTRRLSARYLPPWPLRFQFLKTFVYIVFFQRSILYVMFCHCWLGVYHRKVLLIFYVTPKACSLLVYLVNVKDSCTYVFNRIRYYHGYILALYQW